MPSVGNTEASKAPVNAVSSTGSSGDPGRKDPTRCIEPIDRAMLLESGRRGTGEQWHHDRPISIGAVLASTIGTTQRWKAWSRR